MRVTRGSSGLVAVLLSVAACWLCSGERSYAQSSLPSADELQLFQGLSPEQRDALMKQLGGNDGGVSSSSSSDERRNRYDLNAPEEGRQERRQPYLSEEEKEPLIPVFKAEDWAIIEIDYILPPRLVSPSLQALYAAQGIPPPANNTAATAAAAAAAAGASQSATSANALGASGVPPATPGSTGGALNLNLNQNQNQNQNESGSGTPGLPGLLTDEDKERLDTLMTAIRARNPYRLSRDGVLTLPGFAPIALLGLTEEQATLRLKAEPALRGVDVRITRLPLKKTGSEGLKPFGYDLFDHPLSTFAPSTNVPVPSDYIVGAGDQLNVQLYGKENRSLKLTVGRDGRINLPAIGPITVAGQSFDDVRAVLEERVQRQLIGVHASVSMGDTRSIRVFVLGEARRPGTYTISGLGTITSALYAAGGAKITGSLRNVELKRRGALVRRLDLYDLLIRGDTSDDSKLLPGDVIFIPPVGPTISVYGEVRRPAIYETRGESTVADVLQLAGGLTPEANAAEVMLTRIEPNQRRVVLAVDLAAAARSETVRNGDQLRVTRLRPTLDAGVTVQGHIFTPGTFAYHPGMRLTDIFHSIDELMPNADEHYLLIRRELPPDRQVSVLSADLAAALRAPGSAADVELQARDRITVFDLSTSRDQVIHPVIDELRLQGNAGQPTELVHVDGKVKVPGEYPLEPTMTVADLVRAGGGLSDSAYGGKAELTRYTVVGGQSRRTELIQIDLASALRGDASANIHLQAFDVLSIKEISLWEEKENVTLKGEVRFPGSYAIRRGETLKSVIARAGGLTEYAFPEGSVFTRESLRRREQEQLDLLARRMQTDLTVLALQSAAAGQAGGAAALSLGQALFTDLRTARAVGRLVIDLPRLMREPLGSADDVILRAGDQLAVPKFQQQVTVIGEVQSATSHLYNARLSREDYIALSGGFTRRADRSKIYVVRANGSVVAAAGNRWFEHSSNVRIRPGDTIVVPLDTEHVPALPFWLAVTTILYNVAIAVAAVHAL
jgi:polysaccharide export outer membrane protein